MHSKTTHSTCRQLSLRDHARRATPCEKCSAGVSASCSANLHDRRSQHRFDDVPPYNSMVAIEKKGVAAVLYHVDGRQWTDGRIHQGHLTCCKGGWCDYKWLEATAPDHMCASICLPPLAAASTLVATHAEGSHP